ncbi:TonB-dependent receptor [Microbulbifer aggregans]|uniref:TonB-dependent receptor n=1 Tax=Microbulbifer aggregans TaxID=1769779 RepID=UPI001CFF0410|nr:TonB-dependent receptor [Microbulbifer aggregans]
MCSYFLSFAAGISLAGMQLACFGADTESSGTYTLKTLSSEVHVSEPSSNEAHAIDTVSVTGLRLLQSPVSVAVVDGDTIEQVAATHPSEILNRVAGVWISRGNGQEHLTAIRSPVLTGSGSCGSFGIAEDGVPVRGAGLCNVNQLFDLNGEQAARIEVMRGPGSVLYGSDAQHGVINILSKAPEKRLDRMALEAGANDYRRLSAEHSRVTGDHGYRLSFNGVQDGGFKRDSGFDQQKLTTRHDVDLGGASVRTLLSLSNLNQETAGYVTGKDAYKDAARKRENPNPEAFRDSQAVRVQSRLQWGGADSRQWSLIPYARYTDMAFLMHFLPGTPLEENGQTGAGLRGRYQSRVTDAWSMTSGVDLEMMDAWLKQTQQEGFSSFPAGKQYDYTVNSAVTAVFSESKYTLADNSSFTLGARYESIRYTYRNRMRSGNTAEDGSICINSFSGAPGCRYTRPGNSRDQFENLSFDTSLQHQFSTQLTGSMRLARGSRAPQAAELYRLQNGQMEAHLNSESINSVEFSLRGQEQAVAFDIAVFAMEKADVIFLSSDRLNLNEGETRHYGLEYELSWHWQDWDLGVHGTVAKHQYTSDVSEPGTSTLVATAGNDIDTAPRHLHGAILGWTSEATRLELQWQFTGRYYTDIENQHEYAGHSLAHVRIYRDLGERVRLGLRVNNLANKDYAERADYSSLGGGDRYFIGEPRSLFADVRFQF